MSLTKNDIKLLKEVFATKEDLAGFATKDDLSGLATKKDLEKFVTKDDYVQALSDQTRITVDIMRQETHAIVKRELHLVKKEIIDEISDFIGNSIVPQLDNHETRLTKLESVRA